MATRAKRHNSLSTTAKKRQPSAARSAKTFRQRGYSSKWDKAAKAFIALHPRCVQCGELGYAVDHITPHKGDSKLFWNKRNWQTLCRSCHARKSGRGL